MSVPITIAGTVIQFPSDNEPADWSGPVIQFAIAVQNALALVINAFDVSPQTYTMVANINTNVNLNALSFPTANVRAAFITYSVYRSSTGIGGVSESEAGQIVVVYNPNGPVTQKWELIQSRDGNANITFNITDTGQVQFSTTAITGTNPTGIISFFAKTLQQS